MVRHAKFKKLGMSWGIFIVKLNKGNQSYNVIL